MEHTRTQLESSKNGSTSRSPKIDGDKIMSLDECKKYLNYPELTDQRILDIRNNLIGIVDKIFNAYMEGFK